MLAFVTRCCCHDGDDSDDDGGTTPLLSRESPTIPRPRTYGKKKSSTSTASANIFGAGRSSPPAAYAVRSPPSSEQEGDDDGRKSSPSSPTQTPQPLHLEADRDHVSDDDVDGSNASSSHRSSSFSGDSAQNSINQAPSLSRDDVALKPLTDAYLVDRQRELPITGWNDLLPTGAHVAKIAEASFAEVYRIRIDGEDSILKVMQLKIESDPSSLDSHTTIKIETVVSEIRLMNALTEFPGFVTFKEAHLVRGKPSNSIIRACHNSQWNPSTRSSQFPDPIDFKASSLFLAIKLQDAGRVLEETSLTRIDEVWDVLLGVVVALAHAECSLKFEHRDLHPNNICVEFGQPSTPEPSNDHQRYGFSGFKSTILDYGLSRATLANGDEVYNDLENDLVIFQGESENSQFDTYRRMRTYLFTRNRKMFGKDWHNESNKRLNYGHTWREFRPYNNVLWIRFLLGYLKKNFRESNRDGDELRKFEEETSDLEKRLDPKTRIFNGAFSSTQEIYEYVVQKEWISAEQVVAIKETRSLLSAA